MTTEAQKRAQKKYDEANKGKWRMIHLKLNKETDADIIQKLESVDGIQTYIKQLIRADNNIFIRENKNLSDDLTCDKCEHIKYCDDSDFHKVCGIMEGDGIETCINYYMENQKRHWNCPLFKK